MTSSNIRYAVKFNGIIVATYKNFADALAHEYRLAVNGLNIDNIEIKDYHKVSRRKRIHMDAPTDPFGTPVVRFTKSNYKYAA